MLRNLILSCSLLVAQQVCTAQNLSGKQWQDAIGDWYPWIKQFHPGYGYYVSAQQLDSQFYRLRNLFSENSTISEWEAYTALKTFVAGMQCGHSELYAKQGSPVSRSIKLIPYAGQIRVLKGDLMVKTGDRVYCIQNTSADSIYRTLRNWVSIDGFHEASRDYFLSRSLYLNQWLEHSASPQKDWDLTLIHQQDTLHYCLTSQAPVKPRVRNRNFIKNPKIQNLEQINDSTVLLSIRQFNAGLHVFTRLKILRKIKRLNPSLLILDLRDNPGGRISAALHYLRFFINQTCEFEVYRKKTTQSVPFKLRFLLKFSDRYFNLHARHIQKQDTQFYLYQLKPYQNKGYKGKLTVLINKGTFSAAVLLASYLKLRPNTRFIGSETGGGADGCNAGVFYHYRFKHLPFTYRLPLYRMVQHNPQNTRGRGLLPDIECQYELMERLLKKDKEMEAALKHSFN